MIIGVTGHVNSGKTSFILRYAMSFGREGIVIAVGEAAHAVPLPESDIFRWKCLDSNIDLPRLLNRINRESNIFRADRRVVVVRSVSKYLDACHAQLIHEGVSIDIYKERMFSYRKQLQQAIQAFQGQLFMITNEPASLTPFMSEQERCYHMELAAINRAIAVWSHKWLYMSAGRMLELRKSNERE